MKKWLSWLIVLCVVAAFFLSPLIIEGVGIFVKRQRKASIAKTILTSAAKVDPSSSDLEFFGVLGTNVQTLTAWNWEPARVGSDGRATCRLSTQNPVTGKPNADLGEQSEAAAIEILGLLLPACGNRSGRAHFVIHLRWTDDHGGLAEWIASFRPGTLSPLTVEKDTATGKFFKLVKRS